MRRRSRRGEPRLPCSPQISTLPGATWEAGRHGYSLDEDWELVAGDWILEIWDGNKKLASQTFTLTS